MSLYDIEKLIEQTRKLCVQWYAQGKTTGMTGEIAAFDAARFLDLELCEDKTVGYTAVGKGSRQDKKILIKGRAIFKDQKSRQRLGQLNMDVDWDLLVLVILDEQFEAQEIYEITRQKVEKALDEQKNLSRKGSMTVAKFKVLSELVWNRDQGTVDNEVWEHQGS